MSTGASTEEESTSTKKSKSIVGVLPSIFSSKKEEETKPKPAKDKEDAKSSADFAKEQPTVIVPTLATPEKTAPEAPEDEPDNTMENSMFLQEAPKDSVSPLGSPLKLRSNFGLKKNCSSNQASIKSNGSLSSKLGLKKDKKTPPMPTQTKVLFDVPKNTNTVNNLGEALEAKEFFYANSMFKQVSLQFTKECKTWVVARGQQQDQLRFQALPLHAALVFGAPDELVIKILNAYPLATHGRDVKRHLPTHLAMEHNASEEVVALIIDTFPKCMLAIDKKNMAPLDYINANMKRVHMKNYLPLMIAATKEEAHANMRG